MARSTSKIASKVAIANPLFPRLIIATRPWSFPAALSPLLITFSILYLDDNLDFVNAVLFSTGIVALQAAANLLNSFCDFRSGLDIPETAGDRTLVDALVTKEEFPFLFLSVVGVWFVSFVSTLPFASPIFSQYVVAYVAGLALSVLYSAGTPPLKYIGFGDLAVFLSFGPLLVTAGTWACAITPLSADVGRVILTSFPAAILVVAILHANNHRDMKEDAKNSARTVSVRLGKEMSEYYYYFLVLSPPAIAGGMGLLLPGAKGLLGGVLVFPMAVNLVRMVNGRHVPRDIDAETAKMMLIFGVLTSLGLLVVSA